jgi:hypothetical protein
MSTIQRSAQCALRTLVMAMAVCSGASAQAASTIAGRLLDAGTGLPIAGAVVTLETAWTGLLIEPRAPVVLTSARSLVTGESGIYRFAEVTPGRYRLRFERLGYRGTTLEVEVRRPVEASLSVGLELEPVALQPIRVDQRAASLFHRTSNAAPELDDARVASERLRQSLFLTPDARMLTYADVMDGVTLGEGDVFRALQRLPGVGTRDDYTAELWTRGAPWTHTRVAFDGVPLFNPVHAVGILSAITPEVLGSVFFHPGVRPASIAEGAAGVVDLRSRSGGGTGAVRGVSDLSLASSKLMLEQRIERRGAWIAAARRSHLNLLTNGLGSLGLDTIDLPYVFHDVASRVDLELGSNTRLEASGLWEQDRIEGDVEGVLERTHARWGNTAGRVTLNRALRRLEVSHSIGASRFAAHTDQRLVRTREPIPWTEPASRNQIEYMQITGMLSPRRADGPAQWSLGYDFAWQRGDYEGPLPRYYAVRPDTIAHLVYHRDLRVFGVWGDSRIALSDRISINPSLRAEAGDDFADAPAVRVSPRLAIRYTLSSEQSISAAAGRTWQYVQAIGLAGPSIHPAFHASHFWIWPDQQTPGLRADVVSVGSERWLGHGWLVSASAFFRRASGVALPDPTPGKLGRRPLFLPGDNAARGLELNMRRIGAQWSTSLGYTIGKSDVEVAGWRYPSIADRRHTMDAMLALRIMSSLRVAAAFTAMSGAPFTRAYAVTRQGCEDFGFGCNNPDGSYVQEPNAQRTPPYRSLDASLHWSHDLGPIALSAYAQVRNLLDRDNASTYSGSRPLRRVPARNGTVIIAFEDRFEPGLPRLPLIGLRLTF